MKDRLRDLADDVRRRADRARKRFDGWRDGFVADEYTQRLIASVAGMTHPGNLAAFDHAIAHMPAGDVLEIGTFCGQSALVLDHLMRKYERDARLFCADIWMYLGMRDGDTFVSPADKLDYLRCVAGRQDLTRDAYQAHIKASFIANCRCFAADRLPHAFDERSDAFFTAWEARGIDTDMFGAPVELGGSLAFCYIDGDHSYTQARRDFDNAAKHLAVGGFVLLDDSMDGCGMGSADVAQQVHKDPAFELVSAAPNYLFRKL